MVTVVGVRFKEAGKIYYFNPAEFELSLHDKVIVETSRGIEYGEIVIGPRDIKEEDIIAPLKDVIRKATLEDEEKVMKNKKEAQEAEIICEKKIKKHGLEMKLIDVEYTFDKSKLIFYFTADGRIDFRELVKDLASVFRTRIELRQIGVRDEAKMIGGIGPCGRPVCCCAFLGDFDPVSIKMAKNQNLSLNPIKISGICGRLMCCLRYENEIYKVNEEFPDIGNKVKTKKGDGEVVAIFKPSRTVKVQLDETKEIEEFDVRELEKASEEDK